ncbi:MAG TPA: hypothetical protein VLQ45_05680, partial [Thermoanaerobaculia bacterium]|nr:hypothetical protein [Thermoanaerobaculia bacterium]
MISLPPGLDGLLRALRLNGLPVGARELVRLREAFFRTPALDQDREEVPQLRDLLAAALVHSPEERQLFEPVFESWVKRWRTWEQQDLRAVEPSLERWGLPGLPRQAVPPRRRLVRWNDRSRFAAILLLISILSIPSIVAGIWLVAGLLIPDETIPPAPELTALDLPPLPPPSSPGIPPGLELIPPGPPPKTIRTWVPVLTVEKAVFSLGTLQSSQLGIGVLALLGALTVGVRHRRRRWIPEVDAEPDLPGPERLPLLPLPDPGMVLLDPEGARTMVWGVSRYIAEEQTEDLDLEATVRSTAERAGIPDLRYEPERPLREVWLWLDGTVEDPSLVRYCEEIAASLSESGLAVHLGGFDGDPQEVLWDEGQRVRPLELEAHRQTALVAVCTDGAVLVRHARDARREPIFALLRMLAAWPHLTFVDFSRGATDLARELRRFGIPCILPEALPYFFGFGSASAPPRPTEDPGELRAWRAALALVSPRPVDRASAYAARLALRLRLSPWAFHRLTETGPEAAMRLGDGLVWQTSS